ncbi:MFS transporter [Rhodococcus sp. 66b]|uniref:MFS transporter n=1 Tax=Rhodococcus sp. 66b TaxID=1945511 RepID=UPI0018E3F12E|nr:MFS transporter [Rhodococcus sp. 66b]
MWTVTTDKPVRLREGRSPDRLSRGVVAGYAAGSVGTGGFGVLPGLVLAYYLTDTLGVAAALASLVVIVPKIADVLIDPLIGSISDRSSHRTGTRVPLMLAGALGLPLLFILTFSAPVSAGPGVGALWVLVFFLLAASAYSLFQVPYIALPTELTGDYHERTRLVSVRIAVLALTILVIGAGGPEVRDAAGGGARGYLVMAIGVSALMCGAMIWAVRGAARHTVTHADAPVGSLLSQYRDGFDAIRRTRAFRLLVIVFVLQALATAVMLAGAQYLATYVMGSEGALTGLFVALVGPALVVMPLWYRFSHRYGKLRGYVVSSVLFVVATALLTLAAVNAGSWIYGAVALAGVGYAGMQVFPLAMLPDVIEDDARIGGRQRGGSLSGIWTASETAGLALGPAVFLGVLAVTGFVSKTAGETVVQPESALTGIALGFSVVPAILVAISLVVLRNYRTEQESTHENVGER